MTYHMKSTTGFQPVWVCVTALVPALLTNLSWFRTSSSLRHCASGGRGSYQVCHLFIYHFLNITVTVSIFSFFVKGEGEGVEEDITHYKNLSWEVCVWKFTCFFLMLDFSLHSWLLDRGLNISSALSSVDATSLLSSLGVSEFLKDPQCSRMAAIYQTSINGWKNGTFLDLIYPSTGIVEQISVCQK